MKASTPTEQQFYDRLSPELKKQVDAQRQAASRKAAYAQQLELAKQSESAEAPQWAAQAAQKGRDSTPPPKQ
ncbi:hypothetical protein BDZ90DRAFT_255525 [Jaminaea rosea]|uniref:Uncharacterized protein n=1 Tax=Jaminaea rosea TaxID=1569628 RepID=A0A316UMX5_9BASI|nr:hypothetical protein BDZ90DRAFT_255525 [Jaminaea rosea]PWN25273.1 hypothetical protein BDZ90DRAFT_255525 [Jaminaea rosea]